LSWSNRHTRPGVQLVIESFKGKPLPFGQMQIEIHLNYKPDRASSSFVCSPRASEILTDLDLIIMTDITTVGAFDKWWTTLEDAGLRPFWTDLNFIDVNCFRGGVNVIEVSPNPFSIPKMSLVLKMDMCYSGRS
jgi:hypothetical protein